MGYLVWAAFGFVTSVVVSLAVVGLIVVKLPSTFFLESHDRNLWIDRHPAIRLLGRLIRNLAGISLVILGILLSMPGIPGQGLLTILIGIVLLEFPGKRKLERAILSRRGIKRTLNGLRARFGQPPFQLD